MRHLLPGLLLAAAALPAAAQPSIPPTRAGSADWARAEFRRADANGDGELSRGEVTGAVNRNYGRLSTGRSRILTNMWFVRLDGDKSNRISREEALAFHGEWWNRFDRDRDDRIGPREREDARAFLRNPAR